VAAGTIQTTADGAIVLLRHRQTTGGYPRILQLLDCDIDLAAQLRPGHVLHLELIDDEDAAAIMARWWRCLDRLRENDPGGSPGG